MARTLIAIVAAAIVTLLGTVSATAGEPDPKWSQLAPEQQRVLAPLAKEWEGFDPAQRKKWLGIAHRYPTMNPEQQARVQNRMKRWASMTPAERSVARANFKKKRMNETPEQRAARRQKWDWYQALPEIEKKKLRDKPAKSPAPGGRMLPRPLSQPSGAPPAAPSAPAGGE